MALRLSLVSFRIPKRHPTKETKSPKKAEPPLLYSLNAFLQHQKEPAQRCVSDSTVCLLFGFLKVRSVEPLDVYKRNCFSPDSSVRDGR
jgi:hypothetical protein